MGLCLLVLIAIGSLLFWLYQINKDYVVLALFAPRIRTKDGRPVESIAPVAKGNTIFGNSFDLYGKNHGELQHFNICYQESRPTFVLLAELFQETRTNAKEIGKSYLKYSFGKPIYIIIDAENAELVLNDQNLITKAPLYDFLHPALRTGLLTSTGISYNAFLKSLFHQYI